MRVTCPDCGSKFKVPDKALGTKGRSLKCGKCDHQWHQQPPTPEQIAEEKERAAKAAENSAKKSAKTTGEKPKAKPKPKAEAPPPEPEPEPEEVFADPIDDPNEVDEPEDFGAGARGRGRGLDDDAPDFAPPPLGGVSRFGPRGRGAQKKPAPIALYVLLGCLVLIPAVLLAGRTSLVETWPPMALLYDSIGLHVPVAGEGLELRNVYAQNRAEGSIQILVVAGEIMNATEEMRSLPALRGSVLDDQGQELQGWLFTAEKQLLPPGEAVAFTSEFAAPPPGAAQVNVAFTDERPSTGLGY
jgi:predicted Zn finger-like uncharacterized protein